jgi:hypothetical protein
MGQPLALSGVENSLFPINYIYLYTATSHFTIDGILQFLDKKRLKQNICVKAQSGTCQEIFDA